MFKLVGKNSRVNYGCIDEPVDFNYKDFALTTLMGKRVGLISRRIAASAFNFIGFSNDDFFVGVGAVQLGYCANIFAFVYDYKNGLAYDFSRTSLPSTLAFPMNPDEYAIGYHVRGVNISIKKSHKKEMLEVDCSFKNDFSFALKASYGFKNKPLRVLNPSCGDPTKFTFTEKCPLIKPNFAQMSLHGKDRIVSLKQSSVLYDWSGGFLNRYTHWFWSAFTGETSGVKIGANFAAMVNETFYPENAYWINGKRIRTAHVIFDFDMKNPYDAPWKIFTEDGRVNLTFTPYGERGQKLDVKLLKLSLRQFIGEYNGYVKDVSGKKVTVKKLRGISEIHLSKW